MRSIRRGEGCVDSRIRSVQSLNEMSAVSFGSGILEDPFDADKNKEDQDDREKSCQQTGKCQTRRIASIDDPDECHSHHKQKDERAQCEADVCLFCIFTKISHLYTPMIIDTDGSPPAT